jgi:hypothetical protein
MCAAKSWASAAIQVLDKLFDHRFVQSRDGLAFPTGPIDKMLSRSNVLARRYLWLARVAQLLSEPFKSSWMRKRDSKDSFNMKSSFLGRLD